MKLYEFTRYNPLDDEMQQTLVFAKDLSGAYEEIYGYQVPEDDYRRKMWDVAEYPVKPGVLKLSFF